MNAAMAACQPAAMNFGDIQGTMEFPGKVGVVASSSGEPDGTPSIARSSNGLEDDLVSIEYVTGFFGAERARTLLIAAGLCTEPQGWLPPAISRLEFWELCLNNINLCNDEGHGCTPVRLPKSTWTMLFTAVNQMETLGDGLRRFAELVPLTPSGVAVTIGYGDTGVHLNFGFAQPSPDAERFERYLELIALVFHCVLLWITDEQITPVQIRLSSQLREDEGSMLSGLTAERVRQGQGVTIIYDRRDMALPLGVRKYQYWSNETKAFQELSSNWAHDGDRAPSAIVEKVGNFVAKENLSLQQIAAMMGMSIATLQRRLREAGTSFREIAKKTRCQKMLSLLATDINFDDVAEQLGLSERRSLWRVCHEWLGVSPSEYRRSHRGLVTEACPAE